MSWDEEPPKTDKEVRERKTGALISSVFLGLVFSALNASFWKAVLNADAFWSSFAISFVIFTPGVY